ncbi:MAG TPA: flagellar hook capping FlgD N-terminal domain-containing protein [Chroococcales cyanobacterium]
MDYNSVAAQITAINNSQKAATPKDKTAATGATDALGKTDFLKLLTTQLKYQDPMSPMDDKSFIAQMAQFNSLEEQVKLNKTMTQNQEFSNLTNASSLIGKTVHIKETTTVNGAEQVAESTGTVTEVSKKNDKIQLLIDGKLHDLNSVFEVKNPA